MEPSHFCFGVKAPFSKYLLNLQEKNSVDFVEYSGIVFFEKQC